jgi:hypothetical protein
MAQEDAFAVIQNAQFKMQTGHAARALGERRGDSHPDAAGKLGLNFEF